MNWLRDLIEKLIRALVDWIDRCIPKYQPWLWNDNNGVQLNNNCYNYSCDKQTNTFAQPGRAHGIILNWPDDMACGPVTNGAVADGLVPVNCDEGCGCGECRHQVALVIAPGWDYHWYRKGADGTWTHKPGPTPARSVDDSGNIITDPRTADRGPYTVFCGCFCVNKATVTIT
jgi:hypothetical protein